MARLILLTLSARPFPLAAAASSLARLIFYHPLPAEKELAGHRRSLVSSGNSSKAGVALGSLKKMQTDGALPPPQSQSLSTLCQNLRIPGIRRWHLTKRRYRDCLSPLSHH